MLAGRARKQGHRHWLEVKKEDQGLLIVQQKVLVYGKPSRGFTEDEKRYYVGTFCGHDGFTGATTTTTTTTTATTTIANRNTP